MNKRGKKGEVENTGVSEWERVREREREREIMKERDIKINRS